MTPPVRAPLILMCTDVNNNSTGHGDNNIVADNNYYGDGSNPAVPVAAAINQAEAAPMPMPQATRADEDKKGAVASVDAATAAVGGDNAALAPLGDLPEHVFIVPAAPKKVKKVRTRQARNMSRRPVPKSRRALFLALRLPECKFPNIRYHGRVRNDKEFIAFYLRQFADL